MNTWNEYILQIPLFMIPFFIEFIGEQVADEWTHRVTKPHFWAHFWYVLSSISQELDFSWAWCFRSVFIHTSYCHYQATKVGVNDLDFQQNSKKIFWAYFLLFSEWSRFSPENRASSLFSIYNLINSCKTFRKI